jgi:4'-phosphopantetheinyl transferase
MRQRINQLTSATRTSAGSLPAWDWPPRELALGDDEVHVWRAWLDQPASRLPTLLDTLTLDERARAARFHFQRDRARFIVARGVLRVVLGRYLEIAPNRLRFCYSPYGKPALAEEFGGDELRFNLSHSDGLALYALTRGRELGIDLERIRSDLADEQIAERFFSPREVATLRTLPPDLRVEAFFNCWTRKEAYIKAIGEGLSHPLDQFDVSLIPGGPALLLCTRPDPQEASRWSLQELPLGAGYVAALAVEGHGWRSKCWDWSPPDDESPLRNGSSTEIEQPQL